MRTITIAPLLVVAATAFATACSPYSPDLGATPFLCGNADPKCPDGYACMPDGTGKNVCVQSGGSTPDGGSCTDPNLEPNDTIAQAYQLPIDGGGTKHTFKFASLNICPAGDKDTYGITLSSDTVIEAVLSFGGSGALTAQILGSGGSTLATSSPNGTTGARVYVASLSAGQYYVQVGAAAGITNTYNITFNTCASTSDTLCQQ